MPQTNKPETKSINQFSVKELCQTLQISPLESGALTQSEFPLKIPADFLAQIEIGNPLDPLLKQVLPVLAETNQVAGFTLDPVGDLNNNPTPSLIHKYHGRVLLIASPKCDIHCRYCFRRHFPYEQQINQRHWHKALELINQDKSIHEVILSGGDPMSLSEKALVNLIEKIEQIAHIKTLRIHSRTPVVAPSKAPNKLLLEWAKQSRLNKVLVVHCNHANELSDQTAQLLQQYRTAGFQLLNQTVLLKEVNDKPEILIDLSHVLFNQGVLPYYLHQLDKVQGAGHFEVSDLDALELHEEMRQKLPGYLLPRLVREIEGQPYKTPL
jgi:EF-P beta-lysylation protein EpmB